METEFIFPDTIMKHLIHKVHHFTRRELLIEEIVIILFCIFSWAAALAATALIPVQVNIVNCGTRAELPARCEADSRCCVLLKGKIPSHTRIPEGGLSMPVADPDDAIIVDPEDGPDRHVE